MKKFSKSLMLLAFAATAVCGIATLSNSAFEEVKAELTAPTTVFTNHDAATYYSGINNTLEGSSLLSALQSLNSTRKKASIKYDDMGTTPSGLFRYTDYDPKTVTYDKNGQPYGTRLTTFYSENSATDGMNREHVWPQSHGGKTVENDIHMPRPTLIKENGSRGNSFYVEGKKHSVNGWDPAMESFGVESYRGDSARITLYCVVANSRLGLYEADSHSTSNDNPDYLMGRLSTLLDWNLRYPVLEREQNRNEGAEYLQGNRNPFIDHPEYACKIWGNTNDATKKVCVKAKTVTELKATGSLQQTSYYGGDSFNPAGLTITATYSDGSTGDVSSSVSWPNLTVGQTSVTGTYGGCNVVIQGIKVIEPPTDVDGVTLNLNTATIHINGYVQLTPTISPKTAKNKNVTWSSSNSSVATVNSSGLVVGISEGNTTITVKTEDGDFTATCVVTVSGVQEDETIVITRDSFASGSGYAWNDWSQDDVSGQAYIFLGTTNRMQFNKSKSGYAFFTQTTKGSIKSVTVKSNTASPKWTLYTSNTPYNSSSTTSGNSQGQKAVTTSGVTWNVTNGDSYFSLSMDESGAQYLDSITVEYSNSIPPTPTPKVNSINLPSTLTINKTTSSIGTITPMVDADAGASYTINWSSSDPSVATVSGNNTSATVTALKTGTTTITASAGDKSATCVVTVTENVVPPTPDPKVNSISLPSTLSINKSESATGTLVPTVNADQGASYTINWSSSDSSVATVSGNNSSATVTALKTGSVTITASIGSLSSSCAVTITENEQPENKLVEIAVSNKPDKLVYSIGESFDESGLEVEAHYLDGSSIVIPRSEYSFTAPNTSIAGNKKVTISYGDSFTTEFEIVVVEGTVSNLKIEKYPAKTHYFVSEEFSPIGLKVTAKFGEEVKDVTGLVSYEYNFASSAKVKIIFKNLFLNLTITVEEGEMSNEHKAADFAYVVEENVMDIPVNDVTVNDWNVLEHYYNKLDDGAKEVLKNTVTKYSGGTADAAEELSETLKECAAKYDEIYLAHEADGFNDFMGREPKAQTNKSNSGLDTKTILILVGIAVAVVILVTVIIIVAVKASKKGKKQHA
ncbi:MAG: Ig-like domain-containing protein [Firmicutes bacterium]|nr:Ig-like domain-containing protein [Candidatus Fiminaster equi]